MNSKLSFTSSWPHETRISFRRVVLSLCAPLLLATLSAQPLANERYSIALAADGAVQLTAQDAGTWTFRGDFVVLMATTDPKPAMRQGNIPHVAYNLVTWQTPAKIGGAALKSEKRSTAQAGDGFDDRILDGDTRQRTADVFAAAPGTQVRSTAVTREGEALRFAFAEHADRCAMADSPSPCRRWDSPRSRSRASSSRRNSRTASSAPVPADATAFNFEVEAVTLAGEKQSSGPAMLER